MRPSRAARIEAALDDPMAALLGILTTGGAASMSSFDIGQAAGVPPSTIRSVRNGQVGTVRCETWAALMRWSLSLR